MPDGTGAEIEVSLLTGFSAVAPQDWDSCACPEAAAGRPVDPFTTHRFLLALERSGSVGPGTGWDPRPLVARAEGRVVAVAPLFVKSHSQGEYIFDHGWADALERA
ncbi:MAG: N-acetyltransferase, partial [Rhodobacteraceae bacterium]|nr:N-acetyltransferase [Paracoccaceae bacterium]